MSRRKIILGVAILGGLLLVGWMLATGTIKPTGSNRSADASIPVPSSPLETQTDSSSSLVEMDTGIEPTGEPYVPTAEDMTAWLRQLVEFDTETQTYDKWYESAESLIAFSAQDFPRESINGVVPTKGDWSDGWSREFNPMSAMVLDPFQGQGNATVYTWVIGGNQTLYAPDGSPLLGSYTEVNITAQCAGPTPDTCRVLSYDSLYPIYFENERALAAP